MYKFLFIGTSYKFAVVLAIQMTLEVDLVITLFLAAGANE